MNFNMQTCQTKHVNKHRHTSKQSLYSNTSAKQTDGTQAKLSLAARPLTRTYSERRRCPEERGTAT